MHVLTPVGGSVASCTRRTVGGRTARRAPSVVRLVVLVVCAVLAPALPGLAPRPSAAADSGYRVVDPSAVYVGNPRLFKKPAVVDCDRVYRAIPEYQEILDKNLTDRDVRYHFLMRKASDKFASAVRAVATDGGYDLVAGLGAVVATGTETAAPADVTDATIKKLPS